MFLSYYVNELFIQYYPVKYYRTITSARKTQPVWNKCGQYHKVPIHFSISLGITPLGNGRYCTFGGGYRSRTDDLLRARQAL